MDEYVFIQLAKLKVDRLKLAREAQLAADRLVVDSTLALSGESPWNGWRPAPKSASHRHYRRSIRTSWQPSDLEWREQS